MKAPRFKYRRARSADEALELLSTCEGAKLLAGGQSLVPMLNLRVAAPACLIDINGIAELAYIREERGDVAIGALARHRSVERSELLRAKLPLLAHAVGQIGHPQIRARGTLGGSLCQLDPSAEIPTAAMVLDATIVVGRRLGRRQIAFRDFPAGLMTPAIEPDEMVLEARFTPWPPQAGWGYAHFTRRHGDFTLVSAAVLLLSDDQGRIARISICLGGVEPTPVRLRELEAALCGRPLDADVDDAVRAACTALDPLDDPAVPAWYRRKLAPVMITRALAQAVSRIGNRK